MNAENQGIESCLRENARARTRLRVLVERLRDDDLSRKLHYGWTVAVALAHMTFWDNYALARLTRWEQSGFSSSSSDVDAINSALRPLSEAIPGRETITLALDAADAVDRKVEGLSPELAAAIEAAGHPQTLRRSVHRNEHLDDIERALGNDLTVRRSGPGQ